MALSIIDIGKMAGVSKSTVSRYLNGGYVSKESSDKIKAILDETGFVPQRQAQSMRTRKTNLIGVIVPKISTETTSRVVQGITEVLSPKGYDVLIANTNLSIEKELEYLKLFKNNQVDGIIFMATKINNEHIKIMNELKIPIVIVAQEVEGYPSVYHDDYDTGKKCTEFLLEKGHRNIGFIGIDESDISVGLRRKKGFLDANKENKIELNDEFLKIGDFSQESGYNATKELMEAKNKPSAIFAVTDNMAVGAMEYLKENNYKIPEDVAIISIGDSTMSKVLTPKLTTVHYQYKTSGMESGKILLDLIENEIKSSKNILKNKKISSRLIQRQSV